jgi:hypothetical protein
MRPVAVVVLDVFTDDGFEVTSADDEHAIDALPADGADETLGECIGTRCSDRCADYPDAIGAEDLVEVGCELGIAIPDQELDRACTPAEFIGQGPGLLEYPDTSRMRRHSGHEDLSRVEFDEEQDVESPQSTVSTVKESQASIVVACAFRNSPHIGPVLSAEGSRPWRWRMFQTLEGARSIPKTASSPWIRR